MDAEGIVAGWKRRLIALAGNPGSDYHDTPQELVDREHARLTTFAGYPEADVAAAEERLAVHFPAVFRQYLLELAKSPGELFHRSDLARPAQFERFRFDALALLGGPDPALPREAVVFPGRRPGPPTRTRRTRARRAPAPRPCPAPARPPARPAA